MDSFNTLERLKKIKKLEKEIAELKYWLFKFTPVSLKDIKKQMDIQKDGVKKLSKKETELMALKQAVFFEKMRTK